MLKRFIFIVLLLIPVIVLPQSFIKEYTYTASERDSKIDARYFAMSQIKALAIEEVGTLVSTEIRLTNDGEKQDYDKSILVISEAITTIKIIDEKWDGYKYYIKANVFVDKKELMRRLKSKKIKNSYHINKDISEKVEKSFLSDDYYSGGISYKYGIINHNVGVEFTFKYNKLVSGIFYNFIFDDINKYTDKGVKLGLEFKGNKYYYLTLLNVGSYHNKETGDRGLSLTPSINIAKNINKVRFIIGAGYKITDMENKNMNHFVFTLNINYMRYL